MKEWFKAAGIRAIKTVAQTAVATIGTAVAMGDVNWVLVASASALAGVLSLLTSIAGLPEIQKNRARSATRLIATHIGMAILNISSFILRQITATRH